MSDISVQRQEDNVLVVRWDGDEQPERVVVSPSPDQPHSLDDVIVEVGHGFARLPLAEHHPKRLYVHLFGPDGSHVVAAERLVPLDGPLNFRDIGGYRTADGGRVRWGKVFRSDGLAQLTDADLATLGDLGVRMVCDFRGPHEEAESPTRILPGGPIDLLSVPIGDGSEERKQIWERITDGELTSIGIDEMAAYYILTLDQFAPVFGAVLEHIADPDRHAVVFHCTAGKDRTGMLAALLLSALGVDGPTILHDYELTNGYRSGRRAVIRAELADAGVDMNAYLPFFTAQPEVLDQALAFVRNRWGSVEQYLTGPAGVSRETLTALRRELVRS